MKGTLMLVVFTFLEFIIKLIPVLVPKHRSQRVQIF